MAEAQDELARLRAENARLHAIIDRLERAGGTEPAPFAADTQIIRANENEETPTTVKTARNLKRSKKPRIRRKRQPEQNKVSPFRGCLKALLVVVGMIAAYAGLFVLSIVLSDGLQVFNFWSLLFGGLIIGPVILALVMFVIGQIREQRARRRQAALPRKPRERLRRRITRKLRAATTQKLDAE